MKLKQLITTLALAAGLTTTTAFGAEMYYNRLSTGDVVIPAGTYGDIVVPGDGYCATKFPAARATITQAPGDFGGSYAGIITQPVGDTDIQTHTISGWFKQNTNATTYALLFAPRSQNSSSSSNAHTGYKASLWKTGVLQVGKVKGNLTWNDTDGAHRNSTEKLPINEWFYFTLAITHSDSARKFTAQAFVNGVALPMEEGEIAGNLNGTSCIQILMGDNVECAGFRVDDTAVTDPTTMKSWATNETYVKAFVPKKDYAATISTTEPTDITALDWEPKMPAGGFDAGAKLTITAAVDAVVTVANNLTAKSITFVSEANAVTMTRDEAATVAVESLDFAEVAGTSTVGFNPGTASIVAGADTVLNEAGEGLITIGADKNLTAKSGALTASKITNSGTLNLDGGSEESPIILVGDRDFNNTTLTAGTWVWNKEGGSNKKYNVTGAGANSYYILTRGEDGAPGMYTGTTLSNLILVANSRSGQSLWVENVTLSDGTVGFYLKGELKLNNKKSDNVIRSLSGGGTLSRQHTAEGEAEGLTIRALEDATFSGACSFPITIDASSCVQTFSGNLTGALTVNAGATVAIASTNTAPSSISGEGTVRILGEEGVAKITSDLANFNGTITVDASVTTLILGTARPTATFTFEGETEVHYTENIVDDGHVYELTLEGGETPTYKVYDVNGNEKEVVEGVYVPSVSGKVAWYDFTFTNTLKSVGMDTTGLTRDTNYGLPSTVSAYTSTSNAIFTAIDGHMAPTYPTEWSASVYAKVPKVPNAVLMAFGTNAGGSIALIAGNTNNNEIILARTTGNTPYETLATMKVPNAFTTPHLYSFCKSDKEIKIYLDEALWSTYTSETSISFGNGFQLGSLHGGVHATGFVQYGKTYYDAEVEANNSTVGALRMYKAILGPNAIKALAKEFPYVSPNGSFSRTLPNEAQAFWMADGQWVNDKTQETASKPDAGAAVKLTGVTTTKVLVNLEADTVYESITLNGNPESVLTIKAGGYASFPGQIKAEGLVTVNAPVWLDRTAIDISGVPLTVTENGAITFDLSAFDFGVYFADDYVPLTGISAEYEDQIFAVLPKETPNREVTFGYDSATQTYGLTITVDKTVPFVYTIAESEETGVWTWGDDVANEAAVLARSEADIVKKGAGTQQFVGASKFAYTVDAGTLMFTNGVKDVTASITINAGATFDMNGKIDSEYSIVLNGGTLVNNGDTIQATKRQISGLALTADSTVGGTGHFGLIASGFATNVLELGECTLTKKGENYFYLCNTIVSNGTIKVEEGTLRVLNRQVTFADDAKLELAEGTTLHNTYPLTIGAIAADGATINNTGLITPFTLTGSAILTGNGMWGTNTLNGATVTLDAGCKRGLVFAGAGYVNAVLTAAEIAEEGPITIFEVEEGLTSVEGGTVYDQAGNTVPGNWAGGSFQVDHEAKIGTTYYLTLADAFAAVQEGQTVTLLKSVTSADELTFATGFTLDLNGQTFTQNAAATIAAGTLALTNGAAPAGLFAPNAVITVADGATLDLSALPFGTTYGGIEGTGSLTLASGSTTKFYFWNAGIVDSPNWMFGNYPAFFTGSAIPDGAIVTIGEKTWTGNAAKARFVVTDEIAIATVTGTHNPPQDPATFDYTESFTSIATAFATSKDKTATLTANVAMTADRTINADETLVLDGGTLTIPADYKLTLNGTLKCNADGSNFINLGQMLIAQSANVWMGTAYMFGTGGKFSIQKGEIVQTTNTGDPSFGMKYTISADGEATMSGDFIEWTPGVYILDTYWLNDGAKFTAVEGDLEQGKKCVKAVNPEKVIVCKDGVYTVEDAIQPTPPGEFKPIPFDDAQSATNKADEINANIGNYIKAPEGAETTEAYLALFGASVAWNPSTGKYEVSIALTPEAETVLQAAADDSVAAALDDGTITTIPGLYYTFVGGTDVKVIATPGTKTLATSTETTVPKPELGTPTQAFYQLKIDTKE